MGDLERVQHMFPSVDVEVVAMVFTECDNNVLVTIDKLKEIAPKPIRSDHDWPTFDLRRATDHTPSDTKQEQGSTHFVNTSAAHAQNIRTGEWNQNRKQDWNQIVKQGDPVSAERKRSGTKEPVGVAHTSAVGVASSVGPKVQSAFGPPGLGGVNQMSSLAPLQGKELDRRGMYVPPLNPGPLRHGPMEVPAGPGMQTVPVVHSHSRPEMFTTGMGFGPPRMPSRPGYPPGATVGAVVPPGMGMRTMPRPPPPGVPSHSDVMPRSQSQPAYMRWLGYGGVQDPNFTLTGPPMGGPGRDDRPHPFPQGMPRPPMQGGFGMPPGANGFQTGHVNDPRHMGDVIGPPERMYLVPDVSRSHSAEGDLRAVRRVSGVKGRLVLLRGLPGSGKSTLARSLVGRNGVICSTDDFFLVNGKYVFDASKLSEYHERNKMRAREAMNWGKSPVIIDNTNTTSWEMKPYIIMAQEFGYSVEIREPNTPWRFKTMELARKNKHGVTRAVLDKLLDRFEHRVSVESILQSESPQIPRKQQDTPTSSAKGDENRSHTPTVTRATSAPSPRLGNKGTTVDKKRKESAEDLPAKSDSKSLEAKKQSEREMAELLNKSNALPASAIPVGRPSGRGVVKGADVHRDTTSVSINEHQQDSVSSNSVERVAESDLYARKSKKKSGAVSAGSRFATKGDNEVGVAKIRDELEGIKNAVAMESSRSAVAMDTDSRSSGKRVNGDLKTGGKGVKGNLKGPEQKVGVVNQAEEDLWDSSEELDLSGEEEERNEKEEVEESKEKEVGKQDNEVAERQKTARPVASDVPSMPSSALLGTSRQNVVPSPILWRESVTSGNHGNNSDPAWKQASLSLAPLGVGAWLPKRLRANSDLQGVIESTLHQKYKLEGEMDEKRLYSLSSQCQLVAQLISEHKSMCSLADELITPRNGGVVSLKAVLERMKLGGHHSYLSDDVVKQMFSDRQLMPRMFPLVIPDPVPSGMENGNVPTARKHSKLLKIVRASAERENLDPNMEMGKNTAGEVSRVSAGKEVGESSGQISADTVKYPPVGRAKGMVSSVSLTEHSRATSTDFSDNGVCDIEDPLPSNVTVFPSALPSEGVDSPFSTFTTSELSVSSAKGTEQAHKDLAEPKTVEQPRPKASMKFEDLFGAVSKTKGQSVMSMKSHDLGAVSRDPAVKGKMLSVQELEQQMTQGESAHIQSHSGSNGMASVDGLGTSMGVQSSDGGRARGRIISSTGSVGRGVAISSTGSGNSTPPNLERWACLDGGPTSLESWSPGSHASSHGDDMPPLASTAESAGITFTARPSTQPSADSAVVPPDMGVLTVEQLESRQNHFGHVATDVSEMSNPLTDDSMMFGSSASGGFPGGGAAGASFETDLSFLVECFPDLDGAYLAQLLLKASGDMEETVSMALLSASSAPPLPAYYDYAPMLLAQTSSDSSCAPGEGSSTSLDRELDLSSYGVNGMGTDDTSCDEEIARALQGRLDEQEVGVVKGAVNTDDEEVARDLQKMLNHEEEGRVNGVHYLENGEAGEDDNLVLKLTPSLARQLQQIFGSVETHLPGLDKVVESDLEVLLSERAAREIYVKWIDTLKAKREAYQVHSQLLVDGTGSFVKEASRKKKKKKTKGVPIALEERVQPTIPPSVWGTGQKDVPSAPPHPPGPLRSLLQRLHQQFPDMEGRLVNRVLIDNRYDEAQTTEQLTLIQSGKLPAPVVDSPEVPMPHPHFTRSPAAVRVKKVKTKALRRDEERDAEIKSPFQMLKDPSYNDMRAEAALHAKLRAESFQKAAHARSKKQYEVASYYAQQGHMHTDKMKEANQLAASYTLSLLNDNCSANQIDLHGLHVNEALEALKEKLQQAKPGSKLHVVTGYGSRSRSREGKIKPAVLNLFNSYGLKYVEKNPGLFQVEVKK